MKKLGYIGLVAITMLMFAGCSSKPAATKTSQSAKTEEVKASDKLVTDSNKSQFFVDANWVNKQLEKAPKTAVLEASYGEGESYKKAHLPNAMHMDTMEIETEESHWNILSPESCEKAFLSKGITKDTPLIVYSEDINAASRVAFVAYWLGVKDVKILDGGLDAWKKADYKLEKKAPKIEKATDFGTEVPDSKRQKELIKTPDDLLAVKKENPDLVLASIRSWDEFVGKISGYDYIEDAGEPEGAVYAKSSKSSADVAYLVNKDGTMKNPKAIFAEWKKWGITPDKQVAFYCGTGWRAATAFFLTKEMGWENVALYDGGWYDWDLSHQKDPATYPVQVGDPRQKEQLKIINK